MTSFPTGPSCHFDEDTETIRIVQHPGQGFFSCCTIHLQRIVQYVNQYQKWPRKVDSTQQFMWYKTPAKWLEDIKHDYFELPAVPDHQEQNPTDVVQKKLAVTDVDQEEQYSDYAQLNYTALKPLMQRYFTPTPAIRDIMTHLEQKYRIDPENTCALFYRGNDKVTEIGLPEYSQYIYVGRQLLNLNPGIRFLVQSDETEFLDAMKAEFPTNHIICYDEIRHIASNPTTLVDKVFPEQNAVMSKNFLAIILTMAKCKYVVCGSGNCSFWMALFRGHSDGLVQFNYRT